jgi:cellulose 1,4-beta-cellobiosidase
MASRRWSLFFALVLTGCGGDSGGTGPDTVPGAVNNLAAQVVGGEIQLTWNQSAGAASYSIYMASQSGVTRVNHTTLPGNMFHPNLQLSFDHPPGLDAGTVYYFVVTARNARGESIESCEVSAQINGAVGGTC